MSELQQKRPWYNYDILYIIAEKLLAKVPAGGKIDFCDLNPYTAFMGHNEMAMRVVIAQFAKFKRIDFVKDREGPRIEFYLNVDKSARINESQTGDFSFGGPYIVPPGMLEYIIEQGKFRVTTIETRNFLPDDPTIDTNELGEMSSLKAFYALFLDKQIPDGLNNNIEVRKFTVDERIVPIQNNLETILAIGAVELGIVNFSPKLIIDCRQYMNPIIANNPKEITYDKYFDFKISKEDQDKFAVNFAKFCSLLIRACPALNNLYITFFALTVHEIIDNLYTTVKAVEAGIKSIGIGNENLKITIWLKVNIGGDAYDELPFATHDLFKLGSPFTLHVAYGEPYVSRNLEPVDARGRTHKLQFNIVPGMIMY